MANPPTVLELLSFYLPRLANPETRHAPAWPPDLFGLMSALLERSGAYLTALERWPPASFDDYLARLDEIAEQYKKAFLTSEKPSDLIQTIFNRFLEMCGDETLAAFLADTASAQAALLLLTIADQTFANYNRTPIRSSRTSEFEVFAELSIFQWSPATLGIEIPFERLIILPKRRTPQTGLNIRSLSLHLAAARTSELETHWIDAAALTDRTEVNILLLPWPLKIVPPHFHDVRPPSGLMANMNPNFKWFTYGPPEDKGLVESAIRHIHAASKLCSNIDLVVFPECAINQAQWDSLVFACRQEFPTLALLAGVSGPATHGQKAGTNRAQFQHGLISAAQDKHHRWQINGSQVIQYHLGPSLSPSHSWWECMELKQRKLHFIQLNPWLLFSPLICEDLARPDPAGDLLRAIGPDLVIALLMDGPQLSNRWAARNAITLADDPGSAVLSVTCAGMVDLSNLGRAHARRTVALYKDPFTGLREIDLPNDASAMLLTLSPQRRVEFSADGRMENSADTHPILSGIQFVFPADLRPIMVSEKRGKPNVKAQSAR